MRRWRARKEGAGGGTEDAERVRGERGGGGDRGSKKRESSVSRYVAIAE